MNPVQNGASGAFKWTARRELAAALVAEDTIPDHEIAAAAGVTKRTIEGWKAREEFRARVAAIVQAQRAAIMAEGISLKEKRVEILKEYVARLRRVAEERGCDASMEKVPGGPSGLLVRSLKAINIGGGDSRIVPEYAVDTALLRELREYLKQTAIEMGQWTEKQDVTSGGQPVVLVPFGPKQQEPPGGA